MSNGGEPHAQNVVGKLPKMREAKEEAREAKEGWRKPRLQFNSTNPEWQTIPTTPATLASQPDDSKWWQSWIDTILFNCQYNHNIICV